MANNNIRTVAMRRLNNEGRAKAFEDFTQRLLDAKVPKDVAWKIAIFPYSPANGGTPEIFGDPLYPEIAADWRNGRYADFGEPPGAWRFPEGMEAIGDNYRKGVEPVKRALTYAELEAMVPHQKKATKREIIQWAFHHSGMALNEIDPEGIPCRGATLMLRLAQEDYRTFADRWLKDEEKSAGPQELSDDCRLHLERHEMYEAYLQGERESVFPEADASAAEAAEESEE